MSVAENVNQNERPAGGILNENVPGGRQSFNPEQPTLIAQAIQQGCHESGSEHQSETPLRDAIVPWLVCLFFAALLVWVYFIYPS